MIEISKELLSEVLNYSIDKYTIVSSSEITQIRIFKKDSEIWDYRSYDIHYLAHKCKKWALSKGYYLHSHIKEDNECWCIVKSLDNITQQFSCEMGTEVEAIFKACEWILKEIK